MAAGSHTTRNSVHSAHDHTPSSSCYDSLVSCEFGCHPCALPQELVAKYPKKDMPAEILNRVFFATALHSKVCHGPVFSLISVLLDFASGGLHRALRLCLIN